MASGENTNPSSAFGTFSPLTRGEGRSIGGSREISQPSTLLPRFLGEKVPKADEGAGACAMPAGFLGLTPWSTVATYHSHVKHGGIT